MSSFSIVACVKSQPGVTQLEHTALANAFFPSIAKTVTPEETRNWRISLYLCADDTDQFYVSRAAAVRNLSATFTPWLHLRLLFYPAYKNRVPNREATLQAYTDGADYIHRTNDDISFLTRAWLTASVTALRGMSPPNLGVVGPKVYGDGIRGGATTLDVVHRTHLDIFADYYPPQLDNWFVDDWIAFAYTRGRKRRTFVLHRHSSFPKLDWTVQHQFAKRRYKVAMAQKGYLPALVECGRDTIDEWLNHTERVKAACAAGVPEPVWPRVSCRAVAALPPPSAPSTLGRSLAATKAKGRTRGGGGGKGKGAPAEGGDAIADAATTAAQHVAEVPDTVCRARHEAVKPFEKDGYYPQAAGWCATRFAISGSTCP